MTQQEYEKAKAACWDAFWKENFKGHPVPPTMSIGEVFDYAFAKGYEVGRQMEAAQKSKEQRKCLRDKSKVCNKCHECDIDPDAWHSMYSR